MTEFELTEVLHNNYDIMNDSAVMYFTLVSAYLVTSYIAGKKLTTIQLSIINALYVLWVLGTVNTIYSILLASQNILDKLGELEATILNTSEMTDIAVGGFMLVQLAGLVASLYFMWNTRHSRQ